MNKNILIFGKGFIGSRIRETFNCYTSTKRIRFFKEAENEVKKYNPKIIINCIGHTGRNNVDECELAKNKTLFSNSYLPLVLAEIALRHKIKMVHISSGCIYHYDYVKNRPITERNMPDYFNLFYSRSKIYAERALEVLCNKYNILIVRIRVPLDNRPHPRNILTKLIKYKKVIDTPNSLVYIPDFLKALKYLIDVDARGLYNVVNKGSLRYPQLLDVYKKYVPDFKYKVVDNQELNLERTNLILSTKKLEKTGFKMRLISEVLEECVKAYLKF